MFFSSSQGAEENSNGPSDSPGDAEAHILPGVSRNVALKTRRRRRRGDGRNRSSGSSAVSSPRRNAANKDTMDTRCRGTTLIHESDASFAGENHLYETPSDRLSHASVPGPLALPGWLDGRPEAALRGITVPTEFPRTRHSHQEDAHHLPTGAAAPSMPVAPQQPDIHSSNQKGLTDAACDPSSYEESSKNGGSVQSKDTALWAYVANVVEQRKRMCARQCRQHERRAVRQTQKEVPLASFPADTLDPPYFMRLKSISGRSN